MNQETSSGSAPDATTEPPTAKPSSESFKLVFGPIIRMVEAGGMTPRQISDSRNLIAAHLARMRYNYGRLVANRAKWVAEHKGNYKSLTESERVYDASDTGQREIHLKYEIAALDGLQDALATNWFLIQGEAKSNY